MYGELDNIIHNSFINADEYSFYKTVVAERFANHGLIVDGGSFLGASTRALCDGLSANSNLTTAPSIVALDRFVALDPYVVEFFASSGIDVRFGESFLSIFLHNVSEYLHHIDVRCGELTQVGRIESPIEICVVDIAKSSGMNAYIISNWFTRMIPSISLLVHQDFYAPSHPWIAVSMGALIDHFDVDEEKIGEGACFKLISSIPDAAIQRAVSLKPNSQEAEKCFDVLIERISLENSAPLRLMKAMLYYRTDRKSAAEKEIVALLEVENKADPKWEQWMAIAVSAVMPKSFTTTQFLSKIYAERAAVRLVG